MVPIEDNSTRMLAVTPVHPEGPRYAAPVVYVPGLWCPPAAWRAAASYLGHRGWSGALLDLAAVPGGGDARVAAVAGYVQALPAPPVVVAHDGGAALAVALAGRVPVHALVLVAPLVPGAPSTRAYVWSWGIVRALLTAARCAPPTGRFADAVLADLPASHRDALRPEDPRILAALARPTTVRRPSPMPPCLVVSGETDPVLPPDAARAFAEDLGAELASVSGGHWPFAGAAWQACVGVIHRWLVRRGGAPLLELYEEAMAERDEGD